MAQVVHKDCKRIHDLEAASLKKCVEGTEPTSPILQRGLSGRLLGVRAQASLRREAFGSYHEGPGFSVSSSSAADVAEPQSNMDYNLTKEDLATKAESAGSADEVQNNAE